MFVSPLLEKARRKLHRIYGAIWRTYHQHLWKRRLKVRNFSILCSACIGGVIYHNLGLEFLSPTINLYMSNFDFIKFAVNLKEYCAKDLVFVESEYTFPVAKLGDITIFFNHSETREKAAADWNRRKQRINYDNIYLIFYYRDGYSPDVLREIEKANCKRIAVLTHVPLDLDYVVYMHGNGEPQQNFLEKDMYGRRSFEKEWDFVSWLNGK